MSDGWSDLTLALKSCRAHLLEHSSLFFTLKFKQNGTVQVMGLYPEGYRFESYRAHPIIMTKAFFFTKMACFLFIDSIVDYDKNGYHNPISSIIFN